MVEEWEKLTPKAGMTESSPDTLRSPKARVSQVKKRMGTRIPASATS